MKGVLYKTAIWVTKCQSGERSRKLNMGFAKVIFIFAKVHDQYVLCYMYKQWDPCQSAYRTVVAFSDRQLQRRSQVHSLPKLRSTTRATKNKYVCISVCPTQLRVFAKVLRKFAKVFAKDGLPYPEVASCVPKYVVLYSSLPQLDEDPRQQLKSRIVYLHYLLHLYIDPICTRIWCKYVRLYVAKARES